MVASVGSISVDLITNATQFSAGFNRAATTVDRQSARMARSMGTVDKAAMATLQSIKGLALGFAGGLGAQTVLQYADAWTVAANKIRAAAEISGVQVRSLEELNDIARKTRSGFTETADLYAKLTRAAGNVANSEAEIARATELVNKAFKAGGAAAQEQAAGILQLGQALGSGFLQGDELRSIRENAPVIAQIIADEFGVAIGALKDLGAEGQLTSDRVFQAILNGAEKIEAAFSKTTPTITDGFTQIANSLTELVGTVSTATGGADTFSQFLGNIAENIDTLTAAINKYKDSGTVKAILEGITDLPAFNPADVLGDLKTVLDALGVPTDKLTAVIDDLTGSKMPDLSKEIEKTRQQIMDTEEAIGVMNKAAEENGGKAIAEDFKAASNEAQADLQMLENKLASLERTALAAAKNGSDALAQLAASANAAMDAIGKMPTVTRLTTAPKSGGTSGSTSGGTTQTGGGGQVDENGIPYTVQGGVRVYAEGGYTGNGGKYEPAGIVHKGEYVVPSAAVKRIGLGNLEALVRNYAGGFAEGGPVGSGSGVLFGGNSLSRIEEHTATTAANTATALGYLDTIENDLMELNRRISSMLTVASSSGSSGSYGSGGSSGSITSHIAGGALGNSITPGSGTYGTFDIDRVVTVGGPGGNASYFYNGNELVYTTGFTGFNYTGFASGGIIDGDSQQVQFLKGPDEKVIIARPDQYEDMRANRGGDKSISVGDMVFNVQGQMDQRSAQAMRDMMRREILDVLSMVN